MVLFISKPIYVTINGSTFEVNMHTEEEFMDFINNLNNMVLLKNPWSIQEGDSPMEPAKISFSNHHNK